MLSRRASPTKKWTRPDLPVVSWLVTRTSRLIVIIKASAADSPPSVSLCSQEQSTFMGLNRKAGASGAKCLRWMSVQINEVHFSALEEQLFSSCMLFLVFCFAFLSFFLLASRLMGSFIRRAVGGWVGIYLVICSSFWQDSANQRWEPRPSLSGRVNGTQMIEVWSPTMHADKAIWNPEGWRERCEIEAGGWRNGEKMEGGGDRA